MLRHPSGKLVSVLIVIFWLAMVALFFQREHVAAYLAGTGPETPAMLTRQSDTWMGVFLPGNERVGFINIATTPDRRQGHPGAALNVTAKMTLSFLAEPLDILIGGTGWLSFDDSPADFELRLSSAQHALRVSAKFDKGMLSAQIFTAGETIPIQVPVRKETILAGAMGSAMTLPKLKVGQETQIDSFDPMTMSTGKAKIKCIGEEKLRVAGELLDTKVLVTDLNGLTSKAWVTEDQQVARAETPFGFSLQRLKPQEAMEPISKSTKNTLLDLAAIHPTGRKPFRKATNMVVRLSGAPTRTPPPSDDTQTLSGNTLTIVSGAEPGPQPAVEPGFDEYLKSDAFIQADRPKIKEAAADMIKGEQDIWKRALAIYDWVYNNITKKSVFSIPSALEVLETREGDCNEHAVLYTALARAVGVPTRIAIGVAWSDALDGFYYHAWPEVHVNGRWIWMDPTLGQPIADATHIKLLNGNIETWPQLIPYLGQLKIEVVSIE